MPRYVSILRGINVSGKNKIKMTELADLYRSLAFTAVESYIQSGNVVFGSPAGSNQEIASMIEEGIKEAFGLEVPVIVRSKKDFQKVISHNSFISRTGIDPAFLHVTFLERKPGKDRLAAFSPSGLGQDEFAVSATEVYLYCPGGYGKTKLSNAFLEKQLGVTATTRNWKTVNTLNEMLNA